MENFLRYIRQSLVHIDQRHIRLVLAIITLILFVLGAGAPGSMGGIGD